MRNVEFKAELRDIAIAREICRVMGAERAGKFAQTDTYYRVAAGRLKKRETKGEEVEYIFYDRPNAATGKVSQYTLYSQAQALDRFGREPLPVWVVVKKARELYMLKNTRIHLDKVEYLGTFLEFEFVVSRGHPVEQGKKTLRSLRKEFQMVLGEAIDCSYSDLLAANAEGGRPE